MVKRAYRLREGDQIPTSLVTINEIIVALKVDGRLNPDAVGWYARHVDTII